MITETDLKEAILELQGKRNITPNECIKLASFLTIQREMYGTTEQDIKPTIPPTYSYAAPEPAETVTYDSGTEFSDAIRGMAVDDVLDIVDELMGVLHTFHPRLYNGVMRELGR